MICEQPGVVLTEELVGTESEKRESNWLSPTGLDPWVILFSGDMKLAARRKSSLAASRIQSKPSAMACVGFCLQQCGWGPARGATKHGGSWPEGAGPALLGQGLFFLVRFRVGKVRWPNMCGRCVL